MTWVPLIVWIAVLVLALLVLGFCSYELWWKSAKLRTGLVSLRTDQAVLDELSSDLTLARQRVVAALENARATADET